jgi:glycosyltransferase involved in cell wall biosynthesis
MSIIDISIILVVKNGAGTLKYVLDALRLQENINYEIILVDGGSTDDTCKIFEAWDYKFKKFIDNRNELNIVDSYRKGFESSIGSLIMTIGHDDIICDKTWFFKCKTLLDTHAGISLISGRSLSINTKFESYLLNPPFKSVLFDGPYSHLGVVLTRRVPNDINAIIRRDVFDICFPKGTDCLMAITIPHHYFYLNFFKNNFLFLFIPYIASKSIDMRHVENRRSILYKSIESKARFRVNLMIAMLLFTNLKNIRKKISLLLILKYLVFSLFNNLSKVIKKSLPVK